MKLRVISPFRDKFTKEDYEVGREIECDDDLAESRLKLGLVERIEKGNRPSKKNSIPSTEPENKEKSEKNDNSEGVGYVGEVEKVNEDGSVETKKEDKSEIKK